MSCRRYSQPAPKTRQAVAQTATRQREALVPFQPKETNFRVRQLAEKDFRGVSSQKVGTALVIRHLGNMMRMETVQEACGVRQMKLRVAGLDANKEAVRGCMREARHVENRVVRLGQPVQGEHSQNPRERRAKHKKLKRAGNESRPLIGRAASDSQRISDGRRPVL